jgi:hypothetical protein
MFLICLPFNGTSASASSFDVRNETVSAHKVTPDASSGLACQVRILDVNVGPGLEGGIYTVDAAGCQRKRCLIVFQQMQKDRD